MNSLSKWNENTFFNFVVSPGISTVFSNAIEIFYGVYMLCNMMCCFWVSVNFSKYRVSCFIFSCFFWFIFSSAFYF